MEMGEIAEETLSREIREELGVEIKPIKLIDTWNYIQTIGVIYHCEIITGEITISEEHDGYEWVSLEDIGKVFTRETFVERMKLWKWDLVIDNTITFRSDVK